MSVFLQSKKSLLSYLNATNGTTVFDEDNLILSQPAPVAGTWLDEVTDKNTYLKVTAAPTAPFKGRATIRYDRLNLGDFAHFRPVRQLPAYQPATTHDLLPAILYYYGLNIGPDDVEDTPLSLTGGAGTVTLVAKATSFIWLGSLTFDVIEGGADLNELITVASLEGLDYPVPNPDTQVSALLYVYPMDATNYRDQLLLIPDDAILTSGDAETLRSALTALDTGVGKNLWNTSNASTEWSLEGATVVFNGLNSLAYPTNQAYKYVMAVELRVGVTVPTGIFYLHYNDPEDPDSPN